MEFRPCEAGILTPELYGLGTFEMTPLAKPEPVTDEETVALTQTLTAEAGTQQKPEAGQKDEGSESVTEEQERTIVIKMSWLRNAVAVAAAVLAFFMIGTPVSNSNLDTQMGLQHSSIIPISSQETTATWEEDEMSETIASVSDIQEASEPTAMTEETMTESDSATPATETEATIMQPKEEYCIVLASQVSQKNADRFVEFLGQKGFNEAYITNTKFRRVVYGHYATQEDALSQLRQLRQQSSKLFGEGWVMKSDK